MIYGVINRKEDRNLAAKMTITEILEYSRSPFITELTKLYRDGQKDAKGKLPAVLWMGLPTGNRRIGDPIVPTGLLMIDIDHLNDHHHVAYDGIIQKARELSLMDYLALIHITPSGEGLRVIIALDEFTSHMSIEESIQHYNNLFNFDQYGKLDTVCKDITRISFLVPFSEILYVNSKVLDNPPYHPAEWKMEGSPSKVENVETPKKSTSKIPTEADCEKVRRIKYNDFFVADIVDEYVKEIGTPKDGEVHMYYLDLCKNVRNIVNNDPVTLFAILPKFTHSAEECWKTARSMCANNKSVRIPFKFYKFLEERNYYKRQQRVSETREATVEEVFEEGEKLPDFLKAKNIPPLPPVFRELVSIAPDDFKIPMIYAIIPILGTLTTNYIAEYMSGQDITTTFLTLIYAPPATGKSFIDRAMETLLEMTRFRDSLASARMELYDKAVTTKSSDEKSPEKIYPPKVLMEIKTSETEMLYQQNAMEGRHQLLTGHEIDSFIKGMKAGGGDKTDMLRVDFENGEYSQSYASSATFRGRINLYFNVLFTGTYNQIGKLIKNVEDGLVTRFAYCSIENQRFAKMAVWKKLNRQQIERVNAILAKLDADTYEDYPTTTRNEILNMSISEADKKNEWKRHFKPRIRVDISWSFDEIGKWLEKERLLSAKNLDDCRDMFRKRTGERAAKLALLCTALYSKMTEKDKKLVVRFCTWLADVEQYYNIMLWRDKFEKVDLTPSTMIYGADVFELLGEKFTQNDVLVALKRVHKKTPWRVIKSLWTKNKYIKVERGEKEEYYVKVKNKKRNF